MTQSTPPAHSRPRNSRILAAGAGRLICPAVAAVALAATGAWAQCTSDTILGTSTAFAVDDSLLGVTTGDVNGDGIIDIVTANFSGDSATVLYGNGDGTFGGRLDLDLIGAGDLTAVGIEPAIGDLNGDGRNDIVVGVQSGDLGNPAFAVFLNNPAGGFTGPEFYGFGTQIRGVRVAHLNNDAFLDVFYGNRDDNTLNVALGNGDGTLQPELFTTHVGGPTGAVIKDFNNDGVLDVAASLVFSGEIVITLNDGLGGLTESARYPVASPENLAGGDFNNDGVTDLVTGTAGNSVQFLLGNADGTFQAAQTLDTGLNSLPLGTGVADLNGDGADDIIATHFISSGVNVLLSNGDGTFDLSTAPFPVGSRPRAVAFADFDGNGSVDVVVGNSASASSVSVLLNQCVGTTPVCACETDGDAVQVDVFDLLAYLDLWFVNDAAAELTGDEPASVDVFDLLAFLDCWFPASSGVPCP